MGNNLSSIAPVQVYPHEHYISQLRNKLPRLSYVKSLNSARFLKSVQCQIGARDCVVKIFVLIEQNQNLQPYRDDIELIREKLELSPNCIPYSIIESTDQAMFLIRPYEKTNLYDRMSMRPFLSIIEKKWIAFQMLTALKQCHDLETCHGDIKMENIMVTPSLWIYLTDFASFKPVLLPEDDPADYSYFFDPNWRRLGYVAPERFFNSEHGTGTTKDIEEAVLTPAMDIFSAGCVLAELFAETPLFDLPSLFRYMADEYYPEEILSQIEDAGIKDMIVNMISKDPSQRNTAMHFLHVSKGKIFPNNFYDFLWTLMAQNRQSEDGLTTLLPGMMEAINIMQKNSSTEAGFSGCEDNEISTIFVGIIASNLDDIKDGEGRMIAIQILGSLASLVPQNILNDTIIPALVYMVRSAEETSTALALHTLQLCISQYTTVPRICTNIFPDCVYPSIGEAVRADNFFVRRGVAENIGDLAVFSHRFLVFSTMKNYTSNYLQGKTTLDEAVTKIVASIFSDSVPSVRKAIANHSIKLLCRFFGRERASDALLSHLVTYLNEKRDFLLRMSFYPSIVMVARHVCYRPGDIIRPLLLQGLGDVEESVAAVSVQAIHDFVELNRVQREHLRSILEQVSVLLVHPSIWLRASVVRLISSICQKESVISVLAIFKPKILPFLSKNITRLGDEAVLWGSLKPKIARSIFEELLKSTNLTVLLQSLRGTFQKGPQYRVELHNIEDDQKNRSLPIKRLLAHGVKSDMLNNIVDMKDHIAKVHTNQNNVDAFLNIAAKQVTDKTEFPLTEITVASEFLQSMYYNIPNTENFSSGNDQKSFDSVIYGSSPTKTKSPYSIINRAKNQSCCNSVLSDNEQIADHYRENLAASTASKKQLDAYIKSKISRFPYEHHSNKPEPSAARKFVDREWRPEGQIIGHLHEHSQGITRMVEIPGRTFYATASGDGTCKLWDTAKTERKYPVNKSKGTYVTADKGDLISLACCASGETLAVADRNGAMEIFKLDKLCQISVNHLADADYMATDMNFMELGSHKVLTYSTPYSNICGWDLRSKNISFRLENMTKMGPITSYVISPCQTYLVYGTSFGFIVCWDLRCRMPVSQITNPNSCIRRIKLHPTNPSVVVTAMNTNNSINFYCMEFKTKSKVLWASPVSPVKKNVPVKHTVAEADHIKNYACALHIDQNQAGEIFVLSGGVDAKLRYWNISYPEESKYICNSYTGGKLPRNVPFASKDINGTEYIMEGLPQKIPYTTSELNITDPVQPFPGHKDTITDILMVHQPKNMIISSSMDGVIKIWK